MAAVWGRVCCLPCEMCGEACGCCAKGCQSLSDMLWPEDKPSPIFLIFSVLFAGFPGVFSLLYGISGAFGVSCDQSLALFLVLNGVLGLTYTGFAAHLYIQFGKPYEEMDKSANAAKSFFNSFDSWYSFTPAGATTNLLKASGDSNPVSRAWQLVMNDMYVCIIIPIFPFSIIWSIVGLTWLAFSNDCVTYLKDMTEISAIFMFLYLGLGCMILFISLFCDCCKYTEKQHEANVVATNKAAAAPMAAATAAAATLGAATAGLIDSLFPPQKPPSPEPPMTAGAEGASAYPAPPAATTSYGTNGNV